MKQWDCGGILSPEAGSMACDSSARLTWGKQLRVLIWGDGDQQNHFERILAANIQQWGYDVSILPASFLSEAIGRDSWDIARADVVVCDLDSMLHSPPEPAAGSATASLLGADGNGLVPPVSLARLVIALSSRSVSRSTLEQLGAVALLYKPFEMSLLQRYLVVMQQLMQGEQSIELVPHEEKLSLDEAAVGSIRILVVDDHAEVARTIWQSLECEPAYDVRIAEDGLEALEQCLSWQPQCIVTDLLMPWMNGYQVMRSLLAGQSRYVPAFVVLSALPQHEMPLQPDYLRGKEIVFVEKPFHVDQLLNAVEQVLTQ